MSGPIRCRTCGDVIGVRSETHQAVALLRMVRSQPLSDFSVLKMPCLGVGRHAPPMVEREPRFLGWLRRVRKFYPETHTHSNWFEYQGPRNRLALWLAIHLGVRVLKWRVVYSLFGSPSLTRCRGAEGVVIDGKWVWPDGWFGLIGEGLKNLNAEAS